MTKKIFGFLCFLPIILGACLQGSIEFQNFCYYFESNATSFTNAEIACMGMNGHLASIHDGFTNAVLSGQAGNTFHEGTVTDFWVGLNTLMFSGNWSWTDKSPFDFNNWGPSEPQNLSVSCASVTMQNGLWQSSDCYKQKPYICETAATPTNPAYVNCSLGWTYFEPTHSCYGVDGYGSFVLKWTSAEQKCESLGPGALHSYEETKFLTTLITMGRSAIWTGLYSNDNEVTWKWSDNSPVDYLPWHSGYPNLNVTSCASLWAEQLIDNQSSESFPLICKKPAS